MPEHEAGLGIELNIGS